MTENVTTGRMLTSLPGQMVLTLLVVVHIGCKSQPTPDILSTGQVASAVEEKPTGAGTEEKPVAVVTGEESGAIPVAVAVTVNGRPLYQREIEAAAKALGTSEEEARNLSVQAEVVALEARKAGFPGALRASDRFELSRQFLETIYSEETLCNNINNRQIEEYYEATYQPGWPVDVYSGELVEVRCCQRLDLADCDIGQLSACLERHEPLLEKLSPIAQAWGSGPLPPLDELQKTWSSLTVTDFGILDWPGIPLNRRRPRHLFPESIVSAVRGLDVGEVAGPLKSEIGFHIFKLSLRRGAIESTSPEFRTAARAAICRDRIERTRWDYVKRLLEGAVVEVP